MQAAEAVPPAYRGLFEQAVEQGRGYMRLAQQFGAPPGGGEPAPPGGVETPPGPSAWALDAWRESVERMCAHTSPGPASAPTTAKTSERAALEAAYAAALSEYAGVLGEVGETALKAVRDALPTHTFEAGDAASSLQELYKVYATAGESRYLSLTASPHFAAAQGRLLNTLMQLIGDSADARLPPSVDSSAGAPPFPIPFRPPVAGVHADEEFAALRERLDSAAGALAGMEDVTVGTTPRRAVHTRGKVSLFRYEPTGDARDRVPLLIVYALVNRPYVVDLQPDRSLVRALLDRGLDVYLIDWGYPDASDREAGLEDYIQGHLDACVRHVCAAHDVARVNLLGICQGGTFSLCYSALNPDRVEALITMVTPVDFHTHDNLLGRWVREMDIDLLVDTLGNVPGELLNWLFLSLKPLSLSGGKYLELLELADQPEKLRTFVRMEKWLRDSPDQAGKAFQQFVKDLFQENKLVRNELRIGARPVSLERVDMPVLNIYATRDHIVPPAASTALAAHVGARDYTELAFSGGHIGIYVSERAQREIPPAIANWLHQRVP